MRFEGLPDSRHVHRCPALVDVESEKPVVMRKRKVFDEGPIGCLRRRDRRRELTFRAVVGAGFGFAAVLLENAPHGCGLDSQRVGLAYALG